MGAWAVSLRRAWMVVVGGALAFAAQRLDRAVRRRHARRLAPSEPLMPPLLAPGRMARNQGIAFAWRRMRRRGEVGDGWSTRLGRNLAWLVVLRLERRADERRWRAYQR